MTRIFGPRLREIKKKGTDFNNNPARGEIKLFYWGYHI